MERHPELTVKMVREVCDGVGSYATYTDAGKLFTIATIVGANSGWEGEEQRREWANEPDDDEVGGAHRPRPGPFYWEWRCLVCGDAVRDHPSWWQRLRRRLSAVVRGPAR